MQRLLGSLRAAPLAADQDPLERLLDGRLDPANLPAGHGRLARLLAAATAPATPEELAGQQRVLAQFAAILRSDPPTLIPRRTAVPSKVFSVKAAAAALVAVLSIGGVAAAATGLLPSSARPAVDPPVTTTAAAAAAHGLGLAAVTDLDGAATQGLCRDWQAGQGNDSGRRADSPAFQALAAAAGGADKVAGYCAQVTIGGSAASQGQGSAVGPDATAAAKQGLCRAWQVGERADSGRRAESPAFQALVAAAGGADKVAGFCADMMAGSTAAHGQGPGSRPSASAPSTTVAPPSSGSPPSTGPPATTGPGDHGQGGPPTTTG